MTVKPEVTENSVKNQEAEVKPQIHAQSDQKSEPQSQETVEQINWKKFREERKKEREEKDQITKRAAEKEKRR